PANPTIPEREAAASLRLATWCQVLPAAGLRLGLGDATASLGDALAEATAEEAGLTAPTDGLGETWAGPQPMTRTVTASNAWERARMSSILPLPSSRGQGTPWCPAATAPGHAAGPASRS